MLFRSRRAATALRAAGVPAMRKDFLVDPYQLLEAREAGAGGVLLIVRMLDESVLREMLDLAATLGRGTSNIIKGQGLSEGLALGHVVLHEPRVTVKNVIADDVQKELKRLDDAIDKLRAELDLLLERRDVADGGEHREVLDAYRSFAHDQGWLHRLREAVARFHVA